MTEAARKEIKELLPRGTTLGNASTWPDAIGRKIPDMNPYYFINLPRTPTIISGSGTVRCANCVVEAIPWYLQVLASPTAPRNEKRIALRFIAHLVGASTSRFMLALPRIAGGMALS